MDSNLKNKPVKCYTWSIAFSGALTWKLRKVDQKHLESFKMRCRRRREKNNWTDLVRNEEVLHRVKEERYNLQTIQRSLTGWVTSGVGTRY